MSPSLGELSSCNMCLFGDGFAVYGYELVDSVLFQVCKENVKFAF